MAINRLAINATSTTYIQRDVEWFLAQTGFTLREALNLPPTNTASDAEIAAGMFNDLTLLARNGLLTGLQVLIGDPHRNPGGLYRVRVRLRYTSGAKGLHWTLAAAAPLQEGAGNRLGIPNELLIGARCVMLVIWNLQAVPALRQQAETATGGYRFAWLPPASAYFFDHNDLTTYQEGDEIQA